MNLSIKDLSFCYPNSKNTVLNKISFEVHQGSYWYIAGPNSSGKSTFLKLICGLLPLSGKSGSLIWEDEGQKKNLESWKPADLAKKIAYVPGTLNIEFPITVFEFVVQGRFAHSSFWSKPNSRDLEKVKEALERVGLSSESNFLLNELSSGKLQLAMIARAIAQQPKVYIFDETISNLDVAFQLRILLLIKELHQSGATILLVSHDINLVAEFCKNILCLKKGSLYSFGELKDVLNETLLSEVYDVQSDVKIGENPFTRKPKIFLSHI